MRPRLIMGVERRERVSILRLECQHDRSIGGHVMPDGKPATRHLVGSFYECHDGVCGREQAA